LASGAALTPAVDAAAAAFAALASSPAAFLAAAAAASAAAATASLALARSRAVVATAGFLGAGAVVAVVGAAVGGGAAGGGWVDDGEFASFLSTRALSPSLSLTHLPRQQQHRHPRPRLQQRQPVCVCEREREWTREGKSRGKNAWGALRPLFPSLSRAHPPSSCAAAQTCAPGPARPPSWGAWRSVARARGALPPLDRKSRTSRARCTLPL
jgi:hypothetical protein